MNNFRLAYYPRMSLCLYVWLLMMFCMCSSAPTCEHATLHLKVFFRNQIV